MRVFGFLFFFKSVQGTLPYTSELGRKIGSKHCNKNKMEYRASMCHMITQFVLMSPQIMKDLGARIKNSVNADKAPDTGIKIPNER